MCAPGLARAEQLWTGSTNFKWCAVVYFNFFCFWTSLVNESASEIDEEGERAWGGESIVADAPKYFPRETHAPAQLRLVNRRSDQRWQHTVPCATFFDLSFRLQSVTVLLGSLDL